MKARHVIFALGTCLYVLSFFLPAATEFYKGDDRGGSGRSFSKTVTGAACAVFALAPLRALIESPEQRAASGTPHWSDALVALTISGLINPAFLVCLVVLALNQKSALGSAIRVVVLLMLVAPLFFFYYPGSTLRPNVGYFVWTGAMLIVLFGDKLRTQLHLA